MSSGGDSAAETAGAVGRTDREIDLAAFGCAVARRWRRILLPTLAITGLAILAANLLPPSYTAESRLLVENADRFAGRSGGRYAAQSQIQVIRSRDMVRRVVTDLKLAERPAYAAPPSLIERARAILGLGPEIGGESAYERVLARFDAALHVRPLDRSRMVAIAFTSADPALAAAAANGIAGAYLAEQAEARATTKAQVGNWIDSEIARLRDRIGETEKRLQEARTGEGIAPDTLIEPAQRSELNAQLILARTQRAEVEAMAAAIRAQLRADGPIMVSDVVDSELIRRLAERRTALRLQLGDLTGSAPARDTRVTRLREQLADIEGQLRAATESLATSVEGDARLVGARIEALATQLARATTPDGKAAALDLIARDIRAQRDLLDVYEARARSVGPDATAAPARLVVAAEVPSAPSFPPKAPIILIAAIAAFLAGLLAALIGALRSGEAMRPVPRPGALPASVAQGPNLPWVGGPTQDDAPIADETPATGGEDVLANLTQFVDGRGEEARLLIVTGGEGDEGPSRCAVALARALSARERRVILVCLDVASPALADLAPDARAPGLTDVLFAVASFSETIHREAGSRAHVIPPGRGAKDAEGLVAAERLLLILSALSQTYDHVIVAAPPLGGVAGTAGIAGLSPTVLLVTPPGAPATVAIEAFDALGGQGFTDIAMVTFGPRKPV